MGDRKPWSIPWTPLLLLVIIAMAMVGSFTDKPDRPDEPPPTNGIDWTADLGQHAQDAGTMAAILRDVAQAAEERSLTQADDIRVAIYEGLRMGLSADSALTWSKHFMPKLIRYLRESADRDDAANLADELRQVAEELTDGIPAE